MKTAMWLAAAGAALALFGIAAPAQAQTSWSFGVTIGDGGYYSPWRGSYYDRYYYDRRDWRSCRYDPWCDPYFNRPYRSYRTWAPPVYYAPPPVIVYETRDRYDPLPRWREMAPRDYGYSGYEYSTPQYAPNYSYAAPDGNAPVYQEPFGAAGAPPTLNGAVRYDLAQQGYSPDELQSYRDSLARSGYGYPNYAQDYGAAESYIRGSAADPDRALLGGPR